MITPQHGKELLSQAYLSAVAGGARQSISIGRIHDYGVDGTFRLVEPRQIADGERYRETGFAIDFQAKASTDWSLSAGEVVYDLDANNYNDLAERAGKARAIPLFLVLLCLPKEEREWVEVTDDYLTLKKSAYYYQLRNGALTPNTATKRIRIPSTNLLTPASLTALLKGVESGAVQP